jgi:hypothetical protein
MRTGCLEWISTCICAFMTIIRWNILPGRMAEFKRRSGFTLTMPLQSWREWANKLYGYAGFTDIEFNPYRSIKCQARSCALFLALMKRGLLDEAVKSPPDFIRVLSGFNYRPQIANGGHTTLFGSPVTGVLNNQSRPPIASSDYRLGRRGRFVTPKVEPGPRI